MQRDVDELSAFIRACVGDDEPLSIEIGELGGLFEPVLTVVGRPGSAELWTFKESGDHWHFEVEGDEFPTFRSFRGQAMDLIPALVQALAYSGAGRYRVGRGTYFVLGPHRLIAERLARGRRIVLLREFSPWSDCEPAETLAVPDEALWVRSKLRE